MLPPVERACFESRGTGNAAFNVLRPGVGGGLIELGSIKSFKLERRQFFRRFGAKRLLPPVPRRRSGGALLVATARPPHFGGSGSGGYLCRGMSSVCCRAVDRIAQLLDADRHSSLQCKVMSTIIPAIFENGVLRPLQPLVGVPDKAKVDITMSTREVKTNGTHSAVDQGWQTCFGSISDADAAEMTRVLDDAFGHE